MFRTKKDVDKHVADILSKINNENERNLRGYTFARLYFQIKEYETARRYLSGFLSVREMHALGHKLMGQIYEAKHNLEAAVQSYKRSAEIDGNQKDVILKICELYSSLPVDHETAKYWADRAEQLFSHHEIIFKLREHLVTMDGEPDYQGLEKLITTELTARPKDVSLHIKLLKLYIDTERVKEAFRYALKIENKNPYSNNVDWYDCLTEIFEAYQEEPDVDLDDDFYFHLLTIWDHLVGLTLAEPLTFMENLSQKHGVCNAACNLNIFDQHLYKVWKLRKPHDKSWEYFLCHMRGQLYFRIATLLMKRAKKEQGNWKEACRYAAALFLICYSFKPYDPQQDVWYSQIKNQQLFSFWYHQGMERMCQSGYIIITLYQQHKEEKTKWLTKIKHETCLHSVRERIYNRLFNNIKKTNPSLSHFLQDNIFLTCSLEFPNGMCLQEYNEVIFKLHPDSLHHLIWLSLHIQKHGNYSSKINYKLKAFEGLQFSTSSLTNGAPETLCLLDIESFLYAAVYTSQLAIEHNRVITHSQTSNVSLTVPPDIADSLCSKEQATWWEVVYKLYTNSVREKLGEKRRILQRGLEVIRGVGNHGMSVKLIVHLARTFTDRASDVRGENEESYSEEITNLETRASHYWKIALNMLEKLAKNQTLKLPMECLFSNYGSNPSSEELTSLQEEGQLFLACRAMNEGLLEEAACSLSKLSSPHASFYLALTLKRLAEKRVENKSRREIPSNVWNTHISLLTRARDALHLTLDRIQGDSKHPLNIELHTEIEDVESQLTAADSGVRIVGNANDTDGDDESETFSQSGSLEEEYKEEKSSYNTSNLISSFLKVNQRKNINSSSIKKHLPPSPERLDAQIRALALSHDTLVKTLLDQQHHLIETNRAIVEELRQNKTVVEQLKKQLEEIHISFGKDAQIKRRIKSDSIRTEQEEEDDEGNGYTDGYWDYFVDGSGAVTRGPDIEYRVNYDICQHPNPIVTETNSSVINYISQPTPMTQYRYQYPPTQETNRIYFPPLGPGLPFTEGQQLPQFHFHVSPVPDTSTTRTSVFTRIAPPPNPCFTQPATIVTTSWASKQPVTPGVAHPFQIPVPTSAIGMTNPPSILSTPSLITTQVQISSPNASHNTQLQTLLGSSALSNPAVDVTVTQSLGTESAESDQESTGEVIGDFKPAIPLPAEIDVQTGEENEKIWFEERAKLFRFVEKEWKERGVGTVKILHNEVLGKVRLLMRRDQVLKVCANHNILPNMELQPMKDSDRAWVWAAQDYADEEMKLEQFCIRFKTPEIALSFKTAFQRAVSIMRKSNNQNNSIGISDKMNIAGPQGDICQDKVMGFGDKFRPKQGSWICSTCLITNMPDKELCIACESLKPGSKSQASSLNKEFGELQNSQFTLSNINKLIQPSENTSVKFGTFISDNKVQTSKQENLFSLNVESNKDKTVFGGFTFTSTPVLKSNENVERDIIKVTNKLKDENSLNQSKPSPFAAFSFKLSQSKLESNNDAVHNDNPVSDNSVIIGSEKSNFSIVNSKGTSPSISLPAISSSDADYIFGKESNISNLNFSTISSNNKENSFQKDPNFKGFTGAGSSVFNKTLGKGAENALDNDTPEEFIPTVEFKPLITLPELIDVKTGEEDELKIFGERAKLFRYDSEGKQWKERGIGELKILYNEKTKKYRILMRREQVLKLCANHNILPWMKLSVLSSSDRAWVWLAHDYADGKLQKEQLAAKFKTVEIAQKFREVFEECQIKVENEMNDSCNLTNDTLSDKFSETSSDKRPLSEIIKPLPGSWECTTCYVRNEQKMTSCISCGVPKSTITNSSVENSTIDDKNFMVHGDSSTLENFAAVSANCQLENIAVNNNSPSYITTDNITIEKSNYGLNKNSNIINNSGSIRNTSESLLKPNIILPSEISISSTTTITVSNSVTTTTTVTTMTTTTTTAATTTNSSIFSLIKSPQVFQFNSATSKPLFNIGSSTPLKSTDETDNLDTNVHFKFGSPQKYEFTFSGIRPRSPSKTPKSPGSLTDSSIDKGEEVESPEADNIFFQPVIPLPPKIDIKTGEENEEILYSQRAKLFRFVNGEWKERGVGDLKILHCPETKNIRLLMRRDQVLKVCVNHYITSTMKFISKGDKTVIWAAADFTEGELHPEQLAVRFKTVEIANQFKEAVENAQKLISNDENATKTETSKKSVLANFSFNLNNASTQEPKFSLSAQFGVPSFSKSIFGNTSSQKKSGSEDDIVILEEKHVTADKKAEAEKLMLPNNFYLYEKKPPCPGCRGCDDENEIVIIYENKPTTEQQNKALKLQLPPTFYLYEDKAPCPGCRGCIKEFDDDSNNSEPADSKQSNSDRFDIVRASDNEVSVAAEEKSGAFIESENLQSNLSDLHKQNYEDQNTAVIVSSENTETVSIFGSGNSVSELSFKDIASESSFLKLNNTKNEPFVFSGAGTPLFLQNTTENNEDENEQIEDNLDLQFKPVIPLPEIIEVKTGEEDEIPIFLHRAKLYRYDSTTKQWKERGIGDLKILKHKEKCKFRLILRREQVHKIACNHYINPNLEMNPLSTSNNALCWKTIDYADGQPKKEFFAVRFKSHETLIQFREKFEECKRILGMEEQNTCNESAQINKKEDDDTCCTMNKSLLEDIISQRTSTVSVNEIDGDENKDGNDDDNDDDLIMFEKRVTFSVLDSETKEYKLLGIGTLRVLYDDSIYGARIQMYNDQKVLLCDHAIAVQTCLREEKNNAIWAAIDISVEPPSKRQFRATFSSTNALVEFVKIFEEGKQMAIESEILEPDDTQSPTHLFDAV